MTDPNRNPATGVIDAGLVRTAIAQARQSACQIDDLRAANSRTIKTLEGALNQAVKGVLNAPLTAAEINAAHRRAHRKGVLSRIQSDPELEAFIRARIESRTFTAIVQEVDAAFPPDRRTSISAISRWWRANQDSQSRLARVENHELS
jgi:tellurite resistance protein